MFHFDFAGRDDLTSGILAVEIPDADAEITADGSLVRNGSEWPLPETACTFARLPNGTNWIITAPLVVGLDNGTITCINEGDHTLYGFGMITAFLLNAALFARRRQGCSVRGR